MKAAQRDTGAAPNDRKQSSKQPNRNEHAATDQGSPSSGASHDNLRPRAVSLHETHPTDQEIRSETETKFNAVFRAGEQLKLPPEILVHGLHPQDYSSVKMDIVVGRSTHHPNPENLTTTIFRHLVFLLMGFWKETLPEVTCRLARADIDGYKLLQVLVHLICQFNGLDHANVYLQIFFDALHYNEPGQQLLGVRSYLYEKWKKTPSAIDSPPTSPNRRRRPRSNADARQGPPADEPSLFEWLEAHLEEEKQTILRQAARVHQIESELGVKSTAARQQLLDTYRLRNNASEHQLYTELSGNRL